MQEMFLCMKILSIITKLIHISCSKAQKSQWVIICEIGNVSNLSGSYCQICHFYSSLIYPFVVYWFKIQLDDSTSVIEWFVCTLKLHWKQVLLLYLNTKQNTSVCLSKYCCLSFQSSFTVTQVSMLQFI